MEFKTFIKKPFKDRLKDTGYLIKNSFTIIGKDKDIKTPTIHMIVLSLIITLCIYSALFLFFTRIYILIGVALLLVTIFILMPFRFFYNVRQKADQSWIVYNTICGKDVSYSDAHQHTKSEKGKLRFIAFVDLAMALAKSQKRNKKGFVGFLVAIFLSFIEEVWDLLSHYMLPAIVIEQKSLKEIIPQIKALEKNVPATLVGVFGIDFVGKVISSLFGGIFFVTLLIACAIGYGMAMFTNVTVITLGTVSFSWAPILAMLFLVSLCSVVYKTIVESIKVIYFTIFYTSIMRPMEIKKEFRDELTNYLLMNAGTAPGSTEESASDEQYVAQLSDYIQKNKDKGYTHKQIVDFLLSKGYAEKDINKAMKKIK